MIRASIYLAVCSARNRLRVRLRRLREPRYLIGAVVGVLYLYLTVFSRGRAPARAGRGRRGGALAALPPVFQVAGTSVIGLGVFVLAAVTWLLPLRSGLLEFSQAETEFLFPAPVSRRQLLLHRVIRSQVGSLIASVLVALFATPLSGTSRVRLAIGFWVVFVTIRIYYAAVALTRTRLRSAAGRSRGAAWAPIALFAAGLVILGTSVARQFAQPAAGASDAFVRIARAVSTGLAQVVLWPFAAVVTPPFADSLPAFLGALAGSLAVLAAVTAWMLLNDAVFDEAVTQKGDVQAAEARRTSTAPRARDVGWTLPLTGRLELALLWKGAMETFRGVSRKTLRFAVPAVLGIAGISFGVLSANDLRGTASAVSVVAAIAAAGAILLGPQIARGDLRTDFEHLDLLKTWPVRAADVIRGEMAWPVLLVSATMWAGVLVAAVFSGPALPEAPFVTRWSFALAAAFAGPALIAAQFAVHNTATIFFPAWVQIGSQRSRGIDMMGQRLIMLAAVVLSLAVLSLPGAIGGGVVWLVLNRLLGDAVYVPAAIVFSAIVLVEVLAVTELLGPAYDRIDLTSIERGE